MASLGPPATGGLGDRAAGQVAKDAVGVGGVQAVDRADQGQAGELRHGGRGGGAHVRVGVVQQRGDGGQAATGGRADLCQGKGGVLARIHLGVLQVYDQRRHSRGGGGAELDQGQAGGVALGRGVAQGDRQGRGR